MKTKFIALSALAVAALALFSCAKTEVDFTTEEPIVKEKTGIPFDLTVSTVETKTVNAGDATTWASTDAITLFHAVTGSTTYVYDDAFTANEAGASVKFSGTLGAELDGGTNYDWYAIYPAVDDFNNTPGEFSYVTIGSVAGENQVQAGNDSKAHLAGTYFPLYGKISNQLAATKPALSMKQMASVLAVKVTNRIPEDIVVKAVTITCSGISDGLVGEYQVDITGETPVYTTSTVNGTAKLSVISGDALSTGETGTFYLAVKPFTAAAGQKITIVVTTDKGTQTSVSNALGADFSFQAGKIHDLNFNFTNKSLTAKEFKYNDSEWLTAQGIALPSASAGTNLTSTTQTESPITITTTNGNTATRVFNSGGNYTLRVYANGGSFTCHSTGTNLISKVAVTGTGFGENVANVSTANGSLSGDAKNIIWNGLSQDVTILAEANLTIETITVFYQAATASDYVASFPVVVKTVPYNTTSTTFDVKGTNITDVTAVGTTGFSSASYSADVLTVNMTANESSDPRTITVTATGTPATSSTTLKVIQEGAPTKINTLSNGTTGVTVVAQVTALTTKGIVITDDTGSIYVYLNADPSATYSIGQTVTVSGTVSVNYKGLQFNASGSAATVTPGATGSYVYPSPAEYGIDEIATFNNNTSDRLATYVHFTGVIDKPSSYYNIRGGNGATVNTTLFSTPSSYTSGLATGDYVSVKGYAAAISSGMMAVYVTEVTEIETAPAITFSNIVDVTGTGASSSLTLTPYRTSDATAIIQSKPDWVTSATINSPTCTTLSYTVAENGSTARAGEIVIRLTKSEVNYDFIVKVNQLANLPSSIIDLTTNSSSSASEGEVVWTVTAGTMTATKSGSTPANQCLGTGGHTRFYKNHTLSIAPASGKSISSIVITTVSSYTSGFDVVWTNATKNVSGTTVTLTPTVGTTAVSCTIGAACRATQVKIYYSNL